MVHLVVQSVVLKKAEALTTKVGLDGRKCKLDRIVVGGIWG
jgi:hypothetical protein